MNSGVTDCLVAGFESLEAGLTELPDPDDRHVLAAAIHSGAQEIVTFNLRDFPDTVLRVVSPSFQRIAAAGVRLCGCFSDTGSSKASGQRMCSRKIQRRSSRLHAATSK